MKFTVLSFELCPEPPHELEVSEIFSNGLHAYTHGDEPFPVPTWVENPKTPVIEGERLLLKAYLSGKLPRADKRTEKEVGIRLYVKYEIEQRKRPDLTAYAFISEQAVKMLESESKPESDYDATREKVERLFYRGQKKLREVKGD